MSAKRAGLRAKRTGLLGVDARCMDCGWESAARNAAGTGAQHATRHGHCVHVETTTITIYNPPPPTKQQKAAT